MTANTAASSGTPKFQTLSPFEDEDDEVYSVGPDWFGTPKQQVAQLVGCRLDGLKAVLDAYGLEMLKGGPKLSPEQRSILDRFQVLYLIASPSREGNEEAQRLTGAKFGLTAEETLAAGRLGPVIRGLLDGALNRARGPLHTPRPAAMVPVRDLSRMMLRRNVGRRGRESRPACNRRTRGSRRVTGGSKGGGSSGDGPGDGPGEARLQLHVDAGGGGRS